MIEAEAALRGENDDLRREKHELILKKNELGFYINEHHDHDTVREVNIPLDDKRRRPTNVSKEKNNLEEDIVPILINKKENLDIVLIIISKIENLDIVPIIINKQGKSDIALQIMGIKNNINKENIKFNSKGHIII